MQLDHFVVHIDNDPVILAQIKNESTRAGFPFDPAAGKGTKGFNVANIWIGEQYFEIVRLLQADGGGWQERWVRRHGEGKRGAFCLFLRVPDIETACSELNARGVQAVIERTMIPILFGIFRVKMPWRFVLAGPIPGTSVDIGFIQYDQGALEKYRPRMMPNSAANGILGIFEAVIHLRELTGALEFLRRVFPAVASEGADRWSVALETGRLSFCQGLDRADTKLTMKARCSDSHWAGKGFTVGNIEVMCQATKPAASESFSSAIG